MSSSADAIDVTCPLDNGVAASLSPKRSIVIEEVDDDDTSNIPPSPPASPSSPLFVVADGSVVKDNATAVVDTIAASTATPTKSPASEGEPLNTNIKKNGNSTKSHNKLSDYYQSIVAGAIREDYEAAEKARKEKELREATTITLAKIISECEKQGFYRTPSCNEKLYLHHKGFNKIAEEAFLPYTDVKVLWLEGNCFANTAEKKKKQHPKNNNVESQGKRNDESEETEEKEEEDNALDTSTALHCPTLFQSQHPTLRQFYLHGNLFMATPRALAAFHVLDSVNLSDNFIEEIRFMANPKGLGVEGFFFTREDEEQEEKEDQQERGEEKEEGDSAVEEESKEDEKQKRANKRTAADFNWIDEAQSKWDALISSILDAPPSDDEEEDNNKASDENDDDNNRATITTGTHLSESTAAGDNNNKSKEARRLARFQKAVDAAVALRSVPIPADGIIRGTGADRWGGGGEEITSAAAGSGATNSNNNRGITSQHLSDTLTWLQIKNNHLKNPRDLLQLLTFSNLTSLDLSNNRIENNNGEFLLFLKAMPQLKSLMLQGNPLVRQITPNYRKQILKILPNLMYLDDRPVFADERRLVAAWAVGGADGEKKERLLMKQEEDDKVKRRLEEFRAIMRRGRRAQQQQQRGGTRMTAEDALLYGVDNDDDDDGNGSTYTNDSARGEGSDYYGHTNTNGGTATDEDHTANNTANSTTGGDRSSTRSSIHNGGGGSVAHEDEGEEPYESESCSSEDDDDSSTSSDADDDKNNGGGLVGEGQSLPRRNNNTTATTTNRRGNNNFAPLSTTTFAGSSDGGARNQRTQFYERNYGTHADPMAGVTEENKAADSTANTTTMDAPGTVSWGNYVVRDRNHHRENGTTTNNNDNGGSSLPTTTETPAAAAAATATAPQPKRSTGMMSVDDDDDDFSDVVIRR